MTFAWIFPGQGSQQLGMGKQLFESSRAARDVFERADEALGEALSRLCFEGAEADLALTANTQPALVATSVAAVAALRERFPELGPPAVAAGHSLGEYSALVAAGALSLEDAVRVTRQRGLAMQGAVPKGVGAMLAILGLDADAAAAVCAEASTGAEQVSPANFNAPGQTVVAGHAEAVRRAEAGVHAKGGKTAWLNVSAPFHCPLMRPAAERLAEVLERVPVGELAFPVVANVDGESNRDPSRVRGLLVAQVDSPVRWTACVAKLRAEGATRALEIGPGKVLAGLVKRIDKSLKVASVGDPAGIDAAPAFLAGA